MSKKNQAVSSAKIETPVTNPAPTSSLTVVNESKPKGLTVVKSNRTTTAIAEPAIAEEVLAELKGLNLNTVNSVKTLYASGYSRKQIVAAGFNSSTVYRQVGEWIKAQEALKTATEPAI